MLGINTNVASLTSQSNLFKSGRSLQTSIERLSSGLRINSSRDDAAGLAITERMSTQIRGQDVAKRNANDGISALQVADGVLASVTDNLQRMRELAVQAANGTLNEGDRNNLNLEFQQLKEEVARIIGLEQSAPDTFTNDVDNLGAQFNGVSLLKGTAGDGTAGNFDLDLQIGANEGDTLSVSLNNLADLLFDTAGGAMNDLSALTITDPDNATAIAAASAALTDIDAALDSVTTSRATAGSGINRLEAVIANLDTNNLNLSAARGRILDADFAVETANLTRTQILQQAGTAVLAQSNQLPAQVLALLG